MKQINTYINEKLHITTKSHLYSCQPKTKDELKEIIIQRIKDDGPDCDLNDIDVSKIDDMSHLFRCDEHEWGNKIFLDFNGDISMWNVSNVKNMVCMFLNCGKFNCDISKWDVSNVEYTMAMFWGCEQFNCNISKWDVSNIKSISTMFQECKNFKQNLDRWDVSNVTEMWNTFKGCPTRPKWYKNK